MANDKELEQQNRTLKALADNQKETNKTLVTGFAALQKAGAKDSTFMSKNFGSLMEVAATRGAQKRQEAFDKREEVTEVDEKVEKLTEENVKEGKKSRNLLRTIAEATTDGAKKTTVAASKAKELAREGEEKLRKLGQVIVKGFGKHMGLAWGNIKKVGKGITIWGGIFAAFMVAFMGFLDSGLFDKGFKILTENIIPGMKKIWGVIKKLGAWVAEFFGPLYKDIMNNLESKPGHKGIGMILWDNLGAVIAGIVGLSAVLVPSLIFGTAWKVGKWVFMAPLRLAVLGLAGYFTSMAGRIRGITPAVAPTKTPVVMPKGGPKTYGGQRLTKETAAAAGRGPSGRPRQAGQYGPSNLGPKGAAGGIRPGFYSRFPLAGAVRGLGLPAMVMAGVGGWDLYNLWDSEKTDAEKKKGTGPILGGMLGGISGMALFATLAGAVPGIGQSGIGNAIAGLIGGGLGYFYGGKMGDLIANMLFDPTKKTIMPEWLTKAAASISSFSISPKSGNEKPNLALDWSSHGGADEDINTTGNFAAIAKASGAGGVGRSSEAIRRMKNTWKRVGGVGEYKDDGSWLGLAQGGPSSQISIVAMNKLSGDLRLLQQRGVWDKVGDAVGSAMKPVATVVGELTDSVTAFLSTSAAEAKARSASGGFINIKHGDTVNIQKNLKNGNTAINEAINNSRY